MVKNPGAGVRNASHFIGVTLQIFQIYMDPQYISKVFSEYEGNQQLFRNINN